MSNALTEKQRRAIEDAGDALTDVRVALDGNEYLKDKLGEEYESVVKAIRKLEAARLIGEPI